MEIDTMNEKWFIKGMFEAVEKQMKYRLVLIGELVKSKARKNAPFKTGTLRNSIDYEVEEENKLVRIGTNVEYAAFLEFGTKFITPRFFLTHAYNESIPKIRQIFMKKAVK